MITTDEFTVWLEGFIDYGRNANKSIDNLKKMEKFARYFGNPQKEFKAIHIAGSKGKGSVSIMIASILSEAAVFAGLYTSPHVMDFRERISNSGIFFQDKEYSDAYEKIIAGFNEIIKKEPLIDPGWFEIVTMTAFLLFALQKTEWAVIETGLGGRLDMTNILNPEISVLTPIELEHCNYLGNTIEEIAFEKAGIIKHKTPVVCSRQEDEALKVFKKKAFETDSPFFYLPEIIKTPIAFSVSEKSLKINIEFNNENKIGKLFSRTINTELKLLDEVQAENAALAACTVKYLFPQIKEDIIERGLSKAWLPARFEILSKIPPVIIDGAHTKNSIALCIKTYSKLKLIDKQGVLIFACAEDKDVKSMAEIFKDKFKKIIITIPGESKKSNIEKTFAEFKDIFQNNVQKTVIEKNADYKSVIKNTVAECRLKNLPLLITGSFYLAAEAKTIYNHLHD